MSNMNLSKYKYNKLFVIVCILMVLGSLFFPISKKNPSIQIHYKDYEIQGTAQLYWATGDADFVDFIQSEISSGQVIFTIPQDVSKVRLDLINNSKLVGIVDISLCHGDKVYKRLSGQELRECFGDAYGVSNIYVEDEVVYIQPLNEDPFIYTTQKFIDAYNESHRGVISPYNILLAIISVVLSFVILNFKQFINDNVDAYRKLRNIYSEKKFKSRQGVLTIILLIILVVSVFMCASSIVEFSGLENKSNYLGIIKIFFIFFISLLVVNIIPSLPEKYNNAIRWIVVALPYFNYYLVEKMIDDTTQTDDLVIKLNLIIVYTLYIFICGFFNNYAIGYVVVTCIMAIFGIANFFVIAFRGRAITVTDIYSAKTAADVASAYEYRMGINTFLCILVLICSCIVTFAFVYPKLKLPLCVLRTFVACALSVIMIGNVNKSISENGIRMDYWMIDDSFEENGYILGFYITIGDMTIEKPENYNSEIIYTYVEDEKDINAENQPTNIIVIMNESWSDLSYLGELETNIPYMEYYNSLSGNVVKGKLYVPVFASGTSCSEYEVLTGNSIHFLPQGLSPYEAYSSKDEYSLATTVKAQGYKTIAMHPASPTNWNRRNVYPYMGFEDFCSIEDYDGYEMVREYVGDKGDFEKIIDYLETKDSGEKTFIFNVTMQNHSGYTGVYDGFNVDVNTTNTKEQYIKVNNYLSLVRLTDEALEYLISYLETYDEKTIVVMFGDHYPAVDDEFYSEIMKTEEGISQEEAEKKYATPYLIWANYDANFQDIGNISANYLGSYVLKFANLKTTEYNDFLIKTSETLPILGIYGVYNSNGEYCSYEDVRYSELLERYWHIQYNYIFDKKNRNDKIFSIEQN